MVDKAKTEDICNYNTLRYKCGMCKYKPEEILQCRASILSFRIRNDDSFNSILIAFSETNRSLLFA
jgi:hypothetical protein